MKGDIEVPRQGVYAKVQIKGTSLQPFDIFENKNDVLKIQVDKDVVQTITLPKGKSIGIKSIVDSINNQASGFHASNLNNYLLLEHKDKGGVNTTIQLHGGSAHKTLGLPSVRFFKGKEVLPPWDLVKPSGTPDELARLIVFDTPLKSSDDIFEVSYVTRREDCRRCQGLGIENDIRHNDIGEPEFVEGIDLLVQEVEKIVFTIKGSNIFYTWYGTSINSLVGSKIVAGGRFLETQLVSEINTTLERYRNIKVQQAKYQPVRDQEFLMKVKSVIVTQDPDDPTIFRVKVDLQNRAGVVDSLNKLLVVKYIDGFEFVE
jgi:hypothetical protein